MQYYKLYTVSIEHTMFAYIDKRYNKVESILTNKDKFLVIRRVEYGRNKNTVLATCECCCCLLLLFGSYYYQYTPKRGFNGYTGIHAYWRVSKSVLFSLGSELFSIKTPWQVLQCYGYFKIIIDTT